MRRDTTRPMTRTVAAIALAAGLASPLHAATLALRCTAPAMSNDGSCATPTLIPNESGETITVHFAWQGARGEAGEDSIATTPGMEVDFVRQLPAGLYQVTVWASDNDGIGCPYTAAFYVKGPPARVETIDRGGTP